MTRDAYESGLDRASERAELSESQFGMAARARSLHRSLDSKLCEYKMKERCCPFPLSFIRSFPNFIILPSLLGGVGRDGPRDGFSYSFALFSGLSSAFRYSPNCLVPRPHCTHTTHFLPPLLFLESERAQLRLRGGKQEIRPLRNYGRKEARRVSGRTSDETGPSLSPFRTSF